jgi:hypothetical protein
MRKNKYQWAQFWGVRRRHLERSSTRTLGVVRCLRPGDGRQVVAGVHCHLSQSWHRASCRQSRVAIPACSAHGAGATGLTVTPASNSGTPWTRPRLRNGRNRIGRHPSPSGRGGAAEAGAARGGIHAGHAVACGQRLHHQALLGEFWYGCAARRGVPSPAGTHPRQEEQQQEHAEHREHGEASMRVMPWPVVNDSTAKPCSVSSKTSMVRSSRSRATRVSTAMMLLLVPRDSGLHKYYLQDNRRTL